MKLALDGHWLEEVSGVSTYCRRIFERLPGLLPEGSYRIATRSTQGLPGEIVLPAPSAYRWEQLAFPAWLARGGGDAAFFPDWRIGYFQPRPYVVTLHDLTLFTHIHLYRDTKRAKFKGLYRHWLAKVVGNAKRIITVSEFSRSTIASSFPGTEGKIDVVYNGIDESFSELPPAGSLEAFRRDRLGFSGPYVLNVGRFDYNKNLLFLCRAFLESKACSDHHLILCGKRVNAHYEDVVGFLKERDVGNRVRILSGVGQEEIRLLYRGAALFVLPSLSEGFGLPILEAMASGIPVLAAGNTAIPEIMGKVDGLFDASDAESLKARMAAALGDAAYRNGLLAEGARNITRFGWDNCARKTGQVLLTALG